MATITFGDLAFIPPPPTTSTSASTSLESDPDLLLTWAWMRHLNHQLGLLSSRLAQINFWLQPGTQPWHTQHAAISAAIKRLEKELAEHKACVLARMAGVYKERLARLNAGLERAHRDGRVRRDLWRGARAGVEWVPGASSLGRDGAGSLVTTTGSLVSSG